ncbi:iso-1-cytochrome c [Linnemannia zychae]|nr:iso-1-cytochrome c [Linnemannia zychae]
MEQQQQPGDAVNGARLFMARCNQCHSISQGGMHKAGPNLFNVVGRKAGTQPFYFFSQAHTNRGVVWTEENLFKYLENPKAFVPGTKKSFMGLKNPQDRSDVIAFLKEAK